MTRHYLERLEEMYGRCDDPEPRIFLVAYADTEGPYAVAFSTRENADAFVASFAAWRRDDFTIIDTTIDQARIHQPRKESEK